MKRLNSNRGYSDIYFWICLALAAVSLGAFYPRVISYGDFPYHMEVSQRIFSPEWANVGFVHIYAYPLFHALVKLVHWGSHINYDFAYAFVLATSSIVSIVLFRVLIYTVIDEENIKYDIQKYFIDFMSFGCTFFLTARCGLNEWRFYAIQCGANPQHNPTITAVRPFGIAVCIFFCKIIKDYEKKNINKNHLVAFAIFSVLATIAKPSFTIVFIPAMGLLVLVIIIKERCWKFAMRMLVSVIPCLIVLVMQRVFMSSFSSASNFALCFGTYQGLSFKDSIYACLVVFPVPIILLSVRWAKNNRVYLFSLFVLLIGIIQMFFFTNGSSGDFSWGYDLAVQFATCIALVMGLEENRASLRLCMAYVVFAYQFINGVVYLILMYNRGGEYWF